MANTTLIQCGLAGILLAGRLTAAELPNAADLPPNPAFPDPLVTLHGEKIASREQWLQVRRPELKTLFQHYMYGYFPAAPDNLRATVDYEDGNCFGGKATLKLVTLKFGPAQTPPIHLLLVVPNRRNGPAPAFVGPNFCGNYAALDDPKIPLPDVWMPAARNCPGCESNKATEAGRGTQKDVWALEQSIDRGYAVATFYAGDVDPDKNDFSDGVHPWIGRNGPGTSAEGRGPHDWGTIAAWAWGLSRCADYLVTDPAIDKSRIAVVGHSRMGKTALLAGAFDERFALVIPHQAGCGGSAPSRKIGSAIENAETVVKINRAFPHWFCGEFKNFNDHVEKLPFDQHCLVALCAPRPVLLTNAVEDVWADPDGQFRVLQGADPVYRLLEAGGLGAFQAPQPGTPTLIGGSLAYYMREGKHSMTRQDWQVFLDFADRHMRAK